MVEKLGYSIDGIEEYNNPIPAWLMWLLYGSIIFSVVYLIVYPGFWPGIYRWSSSKMYEQELAKAESIYAPFRLKDEDVIALSKNPAAIAEGKEIFARNCFACHGVEGKGDTGIGPNLTDTEWIYDGAPEAIFNIVKEGTPNGMPSWKTQLSTIKIAKAAAFVHSLGGEQ